MKMAKNILSLVLALVIAAGALVMPAFAADDTEDSYKVGDTVKFGSYPQTQIKTIDTSKITDEKKLEEAEKANAKTTKLLADLNAAANGKTWTDYNYFEGDGAWKNGNMKAKEGIMKYVDVPLYDAESKTTIKYRGVKILNYRPDFTGYKSDAKNSYQDDNGYTAGKVYWFRFDPIEWVICDISRTAKGATVGYMICKNIIDAQSYQNFVKNTNDDGKINGEYYSDKYYTDTNGKKHYYYANNYYHSTIRTWLNGTFCDTAFSQYVEYSSIMNLEKKCIEVLSVNNSSEFKDFSSSTSADRVFLPSKAEATGTIGSSLRKTESTDYAKAQGLWIDEDVHLSYWRLRTAGEHSSAACFVNPNGNVAVNNDVDFTCSGIRPAINLNLPIHDHDNYKSEFTYDPASGKKIQTCKVCGKILNDEPVVVPYTHAEVRIVNNPSGKTKTIRYGQKMRIDAEVDNVPGGTKLVCYYGDGTETRVPSNSVIIGSVDFQAEAKKGTYSFTTEKLKSSKQDKNKIVVKIFNSDGSLFVDTVDNLTKYDFETIKVKGGIIWIIVDVIRTLIGRESIAHN